MSDKKSDFNLFGGISTTDFIPLGLKASSNSLSTIANNIAKEDKNRLEQFEKLFYKSMKKNN